MKTKAVRLYGKGDLRLEEFELPEITDDEVLCKVVSDSLCMSTYKAQKLGEDHARVPSDVKNSPVMVGHEMCGEIVKVGKNLVGRYAEGEKFVLQPALPDGSSDTVGYAWRYCGGNATYVIIPKRYVGAGCLMKYDREDFFSGSLAEPMSCIIGGFHVNYHTDFATHAHKMGIVEGGNCAILAGVGPMGLGAIDYALHGPVRPGLLVVTDIDDARLNRAARIFTPEDAKKEGITLVYLNTRDVNAVEELMKISGGKGYDDVFVYAPVSALIEQADKILALDGCINFFAGPPDKNLSASINFYNVHYRFSHVAANAGGSPDDTVECLELMSKGVINPAVMITHIGGLNCAAESTINLPSIPGGKKLVYTHIDFPLTAIDDFKEKGKTCPVCRKLAEICDRHNGLWSAEAEKYLLSALSK